jgi:hypothetical protein
MYVVVYNDVEFIESRNGDQCMVLRPGKEILKALIGDKELELIKEALCQKN